MLWHASSVNDFCWIWLVLKDPCNKLQFYFWLICIDLGFLTCVDVVHSLWSILNMFFLHFFAPIDSSLLLSIYPVMWDPMRTTFFTTKYSCDILLMFVILSLKIPQSHGMPYDDLSSHTISIFSSTTDFVQNSWNLSCKSCEYFEYIFRFYQLVKMFMIQWIN